MKYPISKHSDYTVISLSGEIDLNESPNVRKQILAHLKKQNNLLIDMSQVEYIDSSGVASLVEGFQTARENQLKFALLGVSESAMQVLKLARLDSIFTLFSVLEEVE